MPSLPMPLRAAIGLAATVVDEARHFPDKAIELPMLAVSTALQVSLRAQQRYALLAAKGDEVINRRPPSDEPPPWATFDAPVTLPDGGAATGPDAYTGDDPDAPIDGAAATDPDEYAGETSDTAPAGTGTPDVTPARKTVRTPRTGRPSAFDAVGDE